MPRITDELIAARIDERSVARGRDYAARGTIVDRQRDGSIVRASCRGTRPEPYRVEVLFDDRGIAEALCTCPVGAQGTCKHVAALLFTYRDQPGAFTAVAPLDERLRRCPKDQLIELIKRLVWRQPALIDLVLAPRGAGAEASNGREIAPANGLAAASPDALAEDDGALADGDEVAALAQLARRFMARPGFALYLQARRIAVSLQCWSLLEPIFAAAVWGPRHRDLRVRMHLHEGNITGALSALPAEIALSQWHVVEQIAAAAEHTQPDTARALYHQYVAALIRHRGRDNYRRACEYLHKVRALYRDSDEWRRYIASLRERHAQLPALLSELDAAGL